MLLSQNSWIQADRQTMNHEHVSLLPWLAPPEW